jgi:hypothetical protein
MQSPFAVMQSGAKNPRISLGVNSAKHPCISLKINAEILHSLTMTCAKTGRSILLERPTRKLLKQRSLEVAQERS